MTDVTSLTDLNFHHVLAATPGASVVFFTAPNCGACRSLKLALGQYLQTYPDTVTLFEVDAVHNGGLVNALDVFHLPALFLYVAGHYHCELHSEPLPTHLHRAIQTALSLPAQEEP